MRHILSTLALWLVYVPAVYAQDLGKPPSGFGGYTDAAPLPVIIGNMVKVVIGLLGIVFLLLIIYAGFTYLTAGGEEEKVKHAKATITRSVIGLIIIIAAYAIAVFVINALVLATTDAPG